MLKVQTFFPMLRYLQIQIVFCANQAHTTAVPSCLVFVPGSSLHHAKAGKTNVYVSKKKAEVVLFWWTRRLSALQGRYICRHELLEERSDLWPHRENASLETMWRGVRRSMKIRRIKSHFTAFKEERGLQRLPLTKLSAAWFCVS